MQRRAAQCIAALFSVSLKVRQTPGAHARRRQCTHTHKHSALEARSCLRAFAAPNGPSDAARQRCSGHAAARARAEPLDKHWPYTRSVSKVKVKQLLHRQKVEIHEKPFDTHTPDKALKHSAALMRCTRTHGQHILPRLGTLRMRVFRKMKTLTTLFERFILSTAKVS